jgi:hypothetical protein
MESAPIRTPRTPLEAQFMEIQRESDQYGAQILQHSTWRTRAPSNLTFAKKQFNGLLNEARNLANIYLGVPKSAMGIEAVYFYDTKDEKEPSFENRRWEAQLPLKTLHFIAAISGEMRGVNVIKARNPLTKVEGYRICSILSADRVMGWQSYQGSRITVAVPLGEIMSQPVKMEDLSEEFYNWCERQQ